MRKLNRKSGFSLIEVACAIGILSILISLISVVQLGNLKLKNFNMEKSRYLFVLEAVKEEIINNNTYEEIRRLYLDNKRVIHNGLLTIDNVKNLELADLFSYGERDAKSYLLMKIEDGSVLKIKLELHFLLNSKEEIYKCEFYKGNYL